MFTLLRFRLAHWLCGHLAQALYARSHQIEQNVERMQRRLDAALAVADGEVSRAAAISELRKRIDLLDQHVGIDTRHVALDPKDYAFLGGRESLRKK